MIRPSIELEEKEFHNRGDWVRIKGKHIMIVVLLLILIGCSNEGESSTNFYEFVEMEEQLKEQDYKSFQKMLSEYGKSNITKEQFERYGEFINDFLQSEGHTSFTKFELIRYNDNQLFLVHVVEEDGKSKISDIEFFETSELNDYTKEQLLEFILD